MIDRKLTRTKTKTNFTAKIALCCTQLFISRASDEIQALFSLHVSTSDDFHDVVQYFGENPRDTTSAEWFTDIAVFVNKFEVEQLPYLKLVRLVGVVLVIVISQWCAV